MRVSCNDAVSQMVQIKDLKAPKVVSFHIESAAVSALDQAIKSYWMAQESVLELRRCYEGGQTKNER
jgi:hypothetical protein